MNAQTYLCLWIIRLDYNMHVRWWKFKILIVSAVCVYCTGLFFNIKAQSRLSLQKEALWECFNVDSILQCRSTLENKLGSLWVILFSSAGSILEMRPSGKPWTVVTQITFLLWKNLQSTPFGQIKIYVSINVTPWSVIKTV